MWPFLASILTQHRNSVNSKLMQPIAGLATAAAQLHLESIPDELLSSHNGYCSANYQLFIELLSMQRGYRSSGGLNNA